MDPNNAWSTGGFSTSSEYALPKKSFVRDSFAFRGSIIEHGMEYQPTKAVSLKRRPQLWAAQKQEALFVHRAELQVRAIEPKWIKVRVHEKCWGSARHRAVFSARLAQIAEPRSTSAGIKPDHRGTLHGKV